MDLAEIQNSVAHFGRSVYGKPFDFIIKQSLYPLSHRGLLRASRSDARLRCSHFLVPTMAKPQVSRRCACVLALARTLETLRVGPAWPCRNVSMRMFLLLVKGNDVEGSQFLLNTDHEASYDLPAGLKPDSRGQERSWYNTPRSSKSESLG